MKEREKVIIPSKFTEPQIMYLYDALCELMDDLIHLDLGTLTTDDMLKVRQEINIKLDEITNQVGVDYIGGNAQQSMPDAGAPIGRTKSSATIHREIRRRLNKHGATIAEKLLEKALGGDVNALVACADLMLAANDLQGRGA